MAPLPSWPELRELARAHGVDTEYTDWRGRQVQVGAQTLQAVLAAFDLDASDPASCAAALAAGTDRRWLSMLPPCVVVRAGREVRVLAHVPDGAALELGITLEDSTPAATAPRQIRHDVPTREIDGQRYGEAAFVLPGDLPTGYHRLTARSEVRLQHVDLIVTPAWLGVPARLGAAPRWGLATQLYSVRSARSWGVGDLADLADLGVWATARHEADFVLINPLHAAEPLTPVQPSPYLPTTRRFGNPLYLRIEDIPECAYLPPAARGRLAQLAELVRPLNDSDRIHRDVVWTAKLEALELIHSQPRTPARQLMLDAYRSTESTALRNFAIWSTLCEVHGSDWHTWPEPLRDPTDAAVGRFADANASRVGFHCWLQWILDEQLAATQATVRRAGMQIGVVHDLAVGVSATGADSWARQDDLARGVTVGAPPDPYAQTGQDWTQPPWRPDRLAELSYSPIREMVRAVLRNAGGLRVDHIIGLFRLWWIPQGRPATEGTYVRYDHEAAIGVLALEAARAGAIVIGEDLGTVEPWVRGYLGERGILGTSILWFEFTLDEQAGRALVLPEQWREYCLASVTTHDLPPNAGYLAGDHVRLRHELGLLLGDLEHELEADRAEQTAWLDEARRRGLLPQRDEPPAELVVEALHRMLVAAPSRLRCLSLTDAVGDRRAQNQPGTKDEYPNWRVALTGPTGTVLSLEDVFADPRAARLADIVRGR